MRKFMADHWKIITLGVLLFIAFGLGLVLGHNLSAISAGSGVVGLIAGWLHKSPSLKAVDSAIAGAAATADNAARQLATGQRATASGVGQMDQLLGTTGDAVAGAAKNLVDESKKLI